MKRTLSLIISLALIMLVFSGCTKAEPLHTVNLDIEPTNEYFEIDVTEIYSFDIKFSLPEDGFLKLLTCDITEYENWDREIWPEFYVTFKDSKGKTLYKDIATSCGYIEKYRFEKGEITAEFTIENKLDDMKMLALSWAFAPDTDEPIPIEVNGKQVAARVNADGVSAFSFSVEKPSILSFCPTEACIYEGDCDFWIETPDGENVTGNINIHGTEWGSRKAFLPAGDYILKVINIDNVASCRIRTDLTVENVLMEEADDLTAPVTLGFTLIEHPTRTIRFNTSDGEKLIISPLGTGNYYEYEHTVDVVIKDTQGNIVATSEDECDPWFGTYVFEFEGRSGEYTATISTQSSCIVDVEIK